MKGRLLDYKYPGEKTHSFNRGMIARNSLMLVYKAEWYGNKVIRVPTMYPSSQTCHCCGYKNPLVKDLAVRKWECPQCHAQHDRDNNASINILNKALETA